MKQLVFGTSEGLLTFQDEEFFHRNARKCGEGSRVGYKGKALLVATDLFIGDVCYGIGRIEGCGSRVIFALQ